MLLRTIVPNKGKTHLLEDVNRYNLAMIDTASIYYARVVDKFRGSDEFGKGVAPQSVGLVHLNDGDVLGVELSEYMKVIKHIEDSCNSPLISDLGLSVIKTNLRNTSPVKTYTDDMKLVIIRNNDISSIRPANSTQDNESEYTLKFVNQTTNNGVIMLPKTEAEILMSKCNPFTNDMPKIDARNIIHDMISNMTHIMDILLKVNTTMSVAKAATIESYINRIRSLFDEVIIFTLNNSNSYIGVGDRYLTYVNSLVELIDDVSNTGVFTVLTTVSQEERGYKTFKHFAHHCVELYRLFGFFTRYTCKSSPRKFNKYILNDCGVESMEEIDKSMYMESGDEQNIVIEKMCLYKGTHEFASIIQSVIAYHGYRNITDLRSTNVVIPRDYAYLSTSIYNMFVKGGIEYTVTDYNFIVDTIADTKLILDGDKERIENIQILKWYKSRI